MSFKKMSNHVEVGDIFVATEGQKYTLTEELSMEEILKWKLINRWVIPSLQKNMGIWSTLIQL